MSSAILDEEGGKQPAEKTSGRSYSPHAIHLLRTAQVNNLALSQMADQKASILMGATFVVFSLVISRSLVGEPPLSLLVLGASAFASSLCAVAAVIPSTGRGELPRQGANRLFFGHFALIDEGEWVESVLDDFTRDEAMFRLALHDIHQHGTMLYRRKYRFLGWAYRLFVVGLALTVLSFAWESL